MSSYREMDSVGRDPARVRVIAKTLLQISNYEWTDWERDFLERMVADPPERLSTRQAEVLFELRDGAETFSHIGGISVSNLLQRAFEARTELDDGNDEWVERKYRSGATSLRRRDLYRLKRYSVQLGDLEPYM